MDFADFDPLTASNDELITWCEQARFIHGGECFRGIVQPASTVVIKIGSDVTKAEARNQTYAYEQLKDTDLQVPRVYRYFSREQGPFRKGFLMMEYISGTTMEKCMTDNGRDEIYAQHIFEAANTLSKIAVPPFQPPGPVGGGEACGYLFEEGCRAEFGSIQQMNVWLNERLLSAQDPTSKIHKSIDIHEEARTGILEFQNDTSMVHGDLAPRNFIMKDDGKLALLDWNYAGFYPKVFEAFCCRVRAPWDSVLSKVYELFMGTTQLDSTFWKLRCVQTVNFRFSGEFNSSQSVPNSDWTTPDQITEKEDRRESWSSARKLGRKRNLRK